MTRAEILATMTKLAEQCTDGATDGGVLIDPVTWRLTSASADEIDASLPAWMRVDREQPVAADGQITVLIDQEAAMQDPIGRQLFDGIEPGGAR
jgi:hypothetical protein